MERLGTSFPAHSHLQSAQRYASDAESIIIKILKGSLVLMQRCEQTGKTIKDYKWTINTNSADLR